MKMNIWYEDLSADEARTLIGMLANFESMRNPPAGKPHLVAVSPGGEASPVLVAAEPPLTVAPPPEAPKTRSRKAAVSEPTPAPVARELYIAKLRNVVQSNYDAAESYLAKVGKEGFLSMTDEELAAACAELVK